jgi:hypothetical protein
MVATTTNAPALEELNAQLAVAREQAMRQIAAMRPDIIAGLVKMTRDVLAGGTDAVERAPTRTARRERMSLARSVIKAAIVQPDVRVQLTADEVATLQNLRARWTKGRTAPAPGSPRRAFLQRIVDNVDAGGKPFGYTAKERSDALFELVS